MTASRRNIIHGVITALIVIAAPVRTAHAQSAPGPAVEKQLASAHFTFAYSDVDSVTIARLADGLERERARIVTDLGGSAPSMVTIVMYTNEISLERASGTTGHPPGMPGRTVGTDHIHVLSPTALGWRVNDDMVSYLAHEFTHCLMASRNPKIENNPRWVWESVATYEAVYRKDPKTLPYMVALQPPTFSELNSMNDARLLNVGYTIGEFVVRRWGKPGLSKLIDANGSVDAALGISQAQFEKDWFAWVRQTYAF